MKKQTAKGNSKTDEVLFDSGTLPQNILAVGKPSHDDKKIYIHQGVYRSIRRFARNKTKTESGGFLVGEVLDAFGKTNIMITGFIEGRKTEATATTLKFTHETWELCHKELQEKYPKSKIIGWIHTHPDFGIFLSEYDKFIQSNFFSEENQVAFVADPIQGEESFYFWYNGNLTKSTGFFMFDKVGAQINPVDDGGSDSEGESGSGLKFNRIALIAMGLMGAAILILMITVIGLSGKLSDLASDNSRLIYNQTLMINKITDMDSRIKLLETKLQSPADGG